jgi:dGTPase
VQTHSRLTHSLKVAQVARTLAENILNGPQDAWETVNALGGLDADVVEAAALAHDLGHPPFGHIGEIVLDRYGREKLNLGDGFEGNAQSFRIVTRLEPRSNVDNGIDSTAATAAAVLKYPWARPIEARGNNAVPLPKFGYYDADNEAFRAARQWLPQGYPSEAQSLEAALMDIADDITYALHDLEDFRTAGLISVSDVESELRAWHDQHANRLRQEREVHDEGTRFGALRRKMESDPRYDAARFVDAIEAARNHMAGLRDAAYRDWRISNETSRKFVSRMITAFSHGVTLNSTPSKAAPPADFERQDWHIVQILKSVTRDRVIARADVAAVQRGQQTQLWELLDLLEAWSADSDDKGRMPDELQWLRAKYGNRGVLDYVASLTDAHATLLHKALAGVGAQTVLLGLPL